MNKRTLLQTGHRVAVSRHLWRKGRITKPMPGYAFRRNLRNSMTLINLWHVARGTWDVAIMRFTVRVAVTGVTQHGSLPYWQGGIIPKCVDVNRLCRMMSNRLRSRLCP